MSQTEDFIRNLYCQSSKISPEAFRQWALLQVVNLLDADAALWGTGSLSTLQFHYQENLGLDEHYGQRLVQTVDINPIRSAVLANLDRPVTMSEVFPDNEFFNSELYQILLEPYGIQRILATGHHEQDSGLYTLISLYRFDRDRDFSEVEKEQMMRLVFHLVSAASHNYFLNLQTASEYHYAAICDKHGIYWQTQPGFFALLNQHYAQPEKRFPLPLKESSEIVNDDLCIRIDPQGELFRISIRQVNPFDKLTEREQQIVAWIVKGLTFKEVARELNLAPSTISNHLYRIYGKLDITSRSDLAKLNLSSISP